MLDHNLEPFRRISVLIKISDEDDSMSELITTMFVKQLLAFSGSGLFLSLFTESHDSVYKTQCLCVCMDVAPPPLGDL